ncbi:MAG: P1 family peptidase [Pseudomonadota bacterium]|nr:P1 family peptidase [Pseudomonadota bacterium]
MLQTVSKPRSADVGLSFGTLPRGEHNAITDVCEVKVGHTTCISSDDVRTGVTAVVPCAKFWQRTCRAATFTIHGNGQLTGADWVNTVGRLESPIMLTNTLCVGNVYTGVIEYMLAACPEDPIILPVVSECYDGFLNNINKLTVTPAHARQTIANAKTGAVAEGNVGAGTGMRAYDFKAGIGTASRYMGDDNFTVGVLVNSNGGERQDLRLAGKALNTSSIAIPPRSRDGSFVLVIATDAPLDALYLQQLARRAAHGLARTGTYSAYGSGEFAIAFSTATTTQDLTIAQINRLYLAVADACEEAIWNSMLAADTMSGYQQHILEAIPIEVLTC